MTDAVSDIVQHPSTDALISEMHSRIEPLEQQLEREREANRENRRLLAAALERIPAIEPPEAPVSPESAAPASDTTTEPRSATEEQQEQTSQAQARPQERSWWRRMFGG